LTGPTGSDTTGITGFTGPVGPTGPAGEGVTGPAGPGGGAALVTSGYIQLRFSGTTFDTTGGTYDITTNFPSSIGTWTVTSATVLTLVFTNTTATLIPPNFTGIVNWYNGSGYRGNMISHGGYGISPNITFSVTASAPYTWTMIYTINTSAFPGATNDISTYGFILQMSMIL
jgi:hypothetical protein